MTVDGPLVLRRDGRADVLQRRRNLAARLAEPLAEQRELLHALVARQHGLLVLDPLRDEVHHPVVPDQLQASDS